jgi:hypothetical protein
MDGVEGRRYRPLVSLTLSSLAVAILALGCGNGGDGTQLHPPAGAGGDPGSGGGQTAGGAAGGGASGGAAGSPGNGGSAGMDPGGPTVCLAPADPLEWPAPAAVNVPEHVSWKTNLELPADPFFALPQGGSLEEIRWVKFIMLASAPDQIFFHDAQAYPFHYEFARDRIPAFQNLTRTEFDRVTLESEGREAILGAVLLPADSTFHPEYAVQIVSNDDVHPELVETVMQTVAAHVTAPDGTRAYYFPSSDSVECLGNKLADFAARGIAASSVDRWLSGDACYAPGWAIGRLVQLPAAEIEAAYLDGRLTPTDILLLSDTPPAELPYLAGILTLAPSTPNAHTAILARSYQVPFAYVRQPNAVARAQALVGRRVSLSTKGVGGRDPFDSSINFDGCDVRLIDVEGVSDADITALLDAKTPPPVLVTPKRASGVMSLSTGGLVPADIDRVGGKAAHFGLLRAAVPDDAPLPALALTFDLWDGFMAQPAPGGAQGTLGDEIARRLAPHSWPADLRALDAALDGVRNLIRGAPFPAALAGDVRDALAGFEPARRIRFRSSTNVEDSETFTGAGLYDSATGCLADDLDGDDVGPSLCNPAELEERGVYRAIQRVYSSFYFDNAYFERLRRGVNENEVGMAILVHYSVPDPEELANGVATYTVDAYSRWAELVTQAGAVSVTNPEGTALPEQVRIDRSEFKGQVDYYLAMTQGSSLLPLGSHVLAWEGEYRTLMGLLDRVADRYAAVTTQQLFALDFEYKKVAPGELSLRQVRPLPPVDSTRRLAPFLVAEPEKLCLYGSERADAFASHRLKARLGLEARHLSLTELPLEQGIYTGARVEYLSSSTVALLEGAPASFTGASHTVTTEPDFEGVDQFTVLDGWRAAAGGWTLRSRVPSRVPLSESPTRTLDDFFFELSVTWDAAVPYLNYSLEGTGLEPATRSEETVDLWGFCPEDVTVSATFPYIQPRFDLRTGVDIQTSYWFPPPPRGVSAGYTAPVIRWERTTISGLTTEPLVLTGYFSQTYAPNHHNFGGQYIFEPRLEPGISAAALAQLEAADIAYLVVIDNDGIDDQLWALGQNGVLRVLPNQP